ncbi:MAG: nucleotidyltransferase domain-containing protein, partial [Myxococcales bacterium]|nr:nucleotidyltransferase domain-containing protein [Myxococcales bacterium]
MSAPRFDVAPRCLFLGLAGSQAHGTAGPESDLDVRGVCTPPLAARLSYREAFEQYEGALPEALFASIRDKLTPAQLHAAGSVKLECVIFDLTKFVRLCSQSNPNTLEILFTPEDAWLLVHPLWRRLHAERRRFLSLQAERSHVGYALNQLQRIKTHRGWLLNPPKAQPARQSFGLPAEATLNRADRERIQQAIANRIADWDIEASDATEALATESLGLPQGVVDALAAERRYRAAMRQWEAYRTWQKQRNPARAALEAQHGYDTKHAGQPTAAAQTLLQGRTLGQFMALIVLAVGGLIYG